MTDSAKRPPKIKPLTAGGFRDYLPVLQIQRGRLVSAIRDVYERFGYDPLETPSIERTNVLTGGDETLDKILYRAFPARGGRWPRREPDQSVCLRFDLTVPLARVVAANPELPKPFRRYQIGNVWRGEKPQLGRFREFLQFDVDIVGSASPLADAEMILIMYTVMRTLGFGTDFTIRVNNRKLLNALAVLGGFAEAPMATEVIRVLDKIDALGVEGVLTELTSPKREEPGAGGVGLSAEQGELVARYLTVSGSPEEVFDGLDRLFGTKQPPDARAGIEELRVIRDSVAAAGMSEACWRIDPTIARGLDYYTGPIWETVLDRLPAIGSVYSGGRYDGLVGRFQADAILPCTGTSVGVDRLFAGMDELGMLQSTGTVTEVLIVNFADALVPEYQRLASALRDEGIATSLYLGEDTSFKAQISYAAKVGVPFVLILGPDDAEAGVVQVKDMEARTQEAIATAGVVRDVAARVRAKRA